MGIAIATIGVALYVAGAFVAFGWITLGGQSVMRSDWVWVSVWPLLPTRPLVSRMRMWWIKRGPVRRDEWRDSTRWIFLGVPAQRIDQWLVKFGEELGCRWVDALERRAARKDARDAFERLSHDSARVDECPLCPPAVTR